MISTCVDVDQTAAAIVCADTGKATFVGVDLKAVGFCSADVKGANFKNAKAEKLDFRNAPSLSLPAIAEGRQGNCDYTWRDLPPESGRTFLGQFGHQ